MAVSSYENNGLVLWRYYVQMRSAQNARIRLQRRGSGFTSQKEAEREERKQLVEIASAVGKLELQGSCWAEVIDRWEAYHLLYPSRKYVETTIRDHAQLLRKWTASWLPRVASEINRGDARALFLSVDQCGKSNLFIKKLKHTVNVVYNWAIEEQLVVGLHQSPVRGVEIEGRREEKLTEILSVEQIRCLLTEANSRRHPWYPIWAVSVLTGCRSGEVHGLRKEDVELIKRDNVAQQLSLPTHKRHYGMIRLQRSWNARMNKYGPLKARYWRNVPVSGQLYDVLLSLLDQDFGGDSHGSYLLPRYWEWDHGQQAQVLRTFCREIGIPAVRFHTLRACFATHLISGGVASATVMKICGWKELKTMERYIRRAGIDERGATESLDFIPSDQGVLEKAASMYRLSG